MIQTKIAVFASGTGSNFKAMLGEDALVDKIALLICDKRGAPVIEYARENRVPTVVISPADFIGRAAYEEGILHHLREHDITWIFLAGYMRLIGPTLLTSFAGNIVNIHPSLLPAFPGLDAIGQAMEAGVRETGVTIHYVDPGMDTGPIITQQRTAILPEDTKDTLKARLQKIEHTLYPQTIKNLIT